MTAPSIMTGVRAAVLINPATGVPYDSGSPLPVGASLDPSLIGAVNETAPASDTASSGLNGRLQRIAQRLTSLLTGIILAAGEAFIGSVGGRAAIVSANFTGAATAAYVSGDLIANHATAGSVVALTLAAARANDKTGIVRRARLKTTDTAAAGAIVRVHFYKTAPTCTNGDSSAWLTTESAYLGYVEMTLDRHFSDAEKGLGVPAVGSEITFEPDVGTQNIYALLEARSGFTPIAAKVWTLTVEVHQN